MIKLQHQPRNVYLPVPVRNTARRNRLSSTLKFLVVVYLVGVVSLTVEQSIALPQNLTLVDFWNVLFLPICWWYLLHSRQNIRFPLALGMWLIFLGSILATFFSSDPLTSVIFIIKEIYLYVWFVTMVAVLASLEPGIVRRILLVWVAVAVVHGVLLVAEFVSPSFYAFMVSILSRVGGVDSRYLGRPAGLFLDPVWAALFQLMAFVPLLLVGFRRELALFLGMLLLLSLLATASLGALTSLIGALVIAVFTLLFMGGYLRFLVWLATIATLATVLFLFTLSLSPDVQASLQHLTTDRAAHTAGERLFLWGGGAEVLFSPQAILGVGPNNYRDFLENKTLHNDTLEFGVERGVIGLFGLFLLTFEAWNSAIKILLNQIKSRGKVQPTGVIFLAMLVGILLESNAHQIFHFRSVWLGLVLLEADYIRMMFPSTKAIAKQAEMTDIKSQIPEGPLSLVDRHDPSAPPEMG